MSIRRQGKIGDFASVVKCSTMSKMIGRIVQTDSYLHHNLLLGKLSRSDNILEPKEVVSKNVLGTLNICTIGEYSLT